MHPRCQESCATRLRQVAGDCPRHHCCRQAPEVHRRDFPGIPRNHLNPIGHLAGRFARSAGRTAPIDHLAALTGLPGHPFDWMPPAFARFYPNPSDRQNCRSRYRLPLRRLGIRDRPLKIRLSRRHHRRHCQPDFRSFLFRRRRQPRWLHLHFHPNHPRPHFLHPLCRAWCRTSSPLSRSEFRLHLYPDPDRWEYRRRPCQDPKN